MSKKKVSVPELVPAGDVLATISEKGINAAVWKQLIEAEVPVFLALRDAAEAYTKFELSEDDRAKLGKLDESDASAESTYTQAEAESTATMMTESAAAAAAADPVAMMKSVNDHSTRIAAAAAARDALLVGNAEARAVIKAGATTAAQTAFVAHFTVASTRNTSTRESLDGFWKSSCQGDRGMVYFQADGNHLWHQPNGQNDAHYVGALAESPGSVSMLQRFARQIGYRVGTQDYAKIVKILNGLRNTKSADWGTIGNSNAWNSGGSHVTERINALPENCKLP